MAGLDLFDGTSLLLFQLDYVIRIVILSFSCRHLLYLLHCNPLLKNHPLFQKISNETPATLTSTPATTEKPPGMYETFFKSKPLILNIPVTNESGSNIT